MNITLEHNMHHKPTLARRRKKTQTISGLASKQLFLPRFRSARGYRIFGLIAFVSSCTWNPGYPWDTGISFYSLTMLMFNYYLSLVLFISFLSLSFPYYRILFIVMIAPFLFVYFRHKKVSMVRCGATLV